MMAGSKHHIVQGEYMVGDAPQIVASTILGSCVAACIHDPVAGVGGMNHFLLPGEHGRNDGAKYGAYLMELLINGLLQRGADRRRMQAKLFGGARLLNGLTDIGRQNAEFAIRFLRDEDIAYLGGSLGGERARRVQFWPATGRARQQLLDGGVQVFATEVARKPPAAPTGELELF